MTTAVMPTQLDIGETAFQNRRNSACRGYDGTTTSYPERREWQLACTTTTTTTAFYAAVSRHRNLSGPCSTGVRPNTLDNRALATPPPGIPGSRGERESREKDHPAANTSARKESSSSSSGRHGSHRKLDRSLSDSEDRINGNGRGVNSSRYKTELCRPFEESGHCKYGDKCQFAHGAHELRNLTRHPKYKTERCRTYHTIGFCPYGPRCHFIHNEDEHLINQRKNSSTSARLSSSSTSSSSSSSSTTPTPNQKQCQFILPPSPSAVLAHRPTNLCGLNSLGSSFESVSSSSSPGNLSPNHVDDPFPPIGTFSPSAVSETPSSLTEAGQEEPLSTTTSGTVFNFPASDAASIGSIMTPLNIQTQQMYNNMLDMAALARFSAVLNISQNQQNNQSSYAANLNVCQSRHQSFESDAPATESCWPICETGPDMVGVAFPPPSNSPHSATSDDSMGSNGSLELSATSGALDNAVHLINSPHDLGRSMRLPIFNKFSTDIES
ncbi:uncharacterized protein LOC143296508 [Babylonia areolata]|uniref:uncharacterized protein LOC143296508 n=1 Tax=Babylonia areolata TaxID=304850 RepID=UPI003FD5196D